MVGRKDAGAHERVRDRHAGQLGELTDLRGRPAACRRRQAGPVVRLPEVRRRWRRPSSFVDRRPRDRRGRHEVRLEDLGEDVHRDGDEDGARPTSERRVPGPGEDAGHLIAAANPPCPLDERLVDGDLIRVPAER